MTTVAAVDFGATSVRVARVDLDARPVAIDVVHRHRHEPVRDGARRAALGLGPAGGRDRARARARACRRARWRRSGSTPGGSTTGWSTPQGRLLSPPHCYRSDRTAGYRAVGRPDRRAARSTSAAGSSSSPSPRSSSSTPTSSTIRDELAGPPACCSCPTCSSTTSRARSAPSARPRARRGWSTSPAGRGRRSSLDAVGVPRRLLPPISPPGTPAGTWRGVPVHLVGGHDTASAVAALPPTEASARAFVATGTWLLVGPGAGGPGHVAGSPGRQLHQRGGGRRRDPAPEERRRLLAPRGVPPRRGAIRRWPRLLDAAAAVTGGYEVFDATDGRFLAPRTWSPRCATRRASPRTPAGTWWCGPSSRRWRPRRRRWWPTASPAPTSWRCSGAGPGWRLLRDELAGRTGLPVRVGATEAAVVGNGLVQGIALGRFGDLAEARAGDGARMSRRRWRVAVVVAPAVALLTAAGARGRGGVGHPRPGPLRRARAGRRRAPRARGRASATCPFELYRPADLGPPGTLHPVVTWGNGSWAHPWEYDPFLRHLASWGFVVIASTFDQVGTGVEMLAGVDNVRQMSEDPDDPLFGHVDLEHVAASGHSQGAGGSVRAATAPDSPITTVLTFDLPERLFAFPEDKVFDVGDLRVPVLLLSGSDDQLISGTATNQRYFAAAPAGAGMALLIGADHNGIQKGQKPYPGYATAWLRYQLSGDPRGRRRVHRHPPRAAHGAGLAGPGPQGPSPGPSGCPAAGAPPQAHRAAGPHLRAPPARHRRAGRPHRACRTSSGCGPPTSTASSTLEPVPSAHQVDAPTRRRGRRADAATRRASAELVRAPQPVPRPRHVGAARPSTAWPSCSATSTRMLLLARRGRHAASTRSPATASTPRASDRRCVVGEGIVRHGRRAGTALRIGNLRQMAKYSRTVRRSFEERASRRPPGRSRSLGCPTRQSRVAVPAMVLGQVVAVLTVESPSLWPSPRPTKPSSPWSASLVGKRHRARLGPGAGRDDDGSAHRGGGVAPRPAADDAAPTCASSRSTAARSWTATTSSRGWLGGSSGRCSASTLREGRIEFTNREVRLDPSLELPAVPRQPREPAHPAEAAARRAGAPPIRIEQMGRGRFRLEVDGPRPTSTRSPRPDLQRERIARRSGRRRVATPRRAIVRSAPARSWSSTWPTPRSPPAPRP